MAPRLLVFVALLGWWSCKRIEAPAWPVGTYNLTACGVGALSVPVPCTVPYDTTGDSVRVRSGTLMLNSDSTWTNVWHEAWRLSGVWGTDTLYALWGTYAAVAGNDSSFQLSTATPASSVMAVIVGNRLELAANWTYQR